MIEENKQRPHIPTQTGISFVTKVELQNKRFKLLNEQVEKFNQRLREFESTKNNN
jgi:hypothetical protein